MSPHLQQIAMTREDWVGLVVRDGFNVEIAPGAPSPRGRKEGSTYGQAKRLAALYLDTTHHLALDDFADRHRFPREKLATAIKNLKRERKYGYRRRHKSRRRPGSTYGLARRVAGDFLDHPEKYRHDRLVCAQRHGMELEALSCAIRALRMIRRRSVAQRAA